MGRIQAGAQSDGFGAVKIVFFGLGSIGTRHASLIKSRYKHQLYAFRSGKGLRNKNALGIPELHSWRELDLIKPDVAFITNPTSLHIQTAAKCAARNMALFIEKPLTHHPRGLSQFLRLVKRKKIATYVGFVLRFHPIIKALSQHLRKARPVHMRVVATSFLPLWRPQQNHFKNYSAFKKMGGGVLHDLSHEIDYARYLMGDFLHMIGRSLRRGTVTVDADDCADLFILSKRGPINIHINMMSQIKQRQIQIDFSDHSVVGDLIGNTIVEYRFGKPFKKRSVGKGLDEAYRDQLEYFFRNIHNHNMMNNVSEAAHLFHWIHEFEKKKN